MKKKNIFLGLLTGSAMLICATAFLSNNTSQVKAEDSNPIVVGNDNYIYGTNMEDWDDDEENCYITLHVDINSGNATSFDWQIADEFDSDTWESVDEEGATGTLESDTTETSLRFIPTEDKWYRCVLSNETSNVSTIPVKIIYKNYRYYISNDQMAYSIIDESTYDVIGKYNGEWIGRTSYDGYWNFYTSPNSEPERITVTGTSPSSEAHLEYVKCSFDLDNEFLLWFDNKLMDSEHAFAISCDVKIKDNDDAPTTAVRDYANILQQLQLVDTDGELEDAEDDDPALVLNFQEFAPTYWGIEEYDARNIFDFNYISESYSPSYLKADERGVVYEINGNDSGIAASWTGLKEGENIRFSYSIGTVVQTGASLKATIASSESSISVTVDADTTIQIFPVGSDTPLALKPVAGQENTYEPSNDPDAITVIEAEEAGTFIVTNLPSNTKYTIVVSDADNNTIIQDAATNINPLTPENPNVPEDQQPTISEITGTSLKAENLNPNFSYNIQDENGLNVFPTYQSPVDGEVYFDGLMPGTVYYFVAKSDVTNGSTRIEFMTDFAIYFDSNGGYPKIATQYATSEGTGKATEPSFTPSRDGYGFDCWVTFNDEPWDFDNDLVTENTILFARWIEKEPLPISLPTLSMDDYTYGSTPSTPELTAPLADGVEGVYYCYKDGDESNPFVWENITPTTLEGGEYCIILLIPETTQYAGKSTNIAYFSVLQATDNEITNLNLTGWKYGSTPNTPTATAKYGQDKIVYKYSTSGDGYYSSSVPTNIGTYWVKAEVYETDSYNGAESKKSFTIAKGDPVYVAPTANELTYTGEEQELITAGSSEHGTFTYSLEEEGTYTSSIPSKTNAGTYVVYWKLTAKSNYVDASGSVTVTIQKIPNAITGLAIEGWESGATPNDPTATATYGEIVYTYSTSENGTYTSDRPTAPGTYWLKAEVAESENYAGAVCKISFVITGDTTPCVIHWVLIAVFVVGVAGAVVTYFLKMKKLITLIISSSGLLINLILSFFSGCTACIVFSVISIVAFAAIDGYLVYLMFFKDKDKNKSQKETTK